MSTRRSSSKPRRAAAPQAASHRTIIQTLGRQPDQLLRLGKKLRTADLKQDAGLYFEAARKLAPDQPEIQEHCALHALEQGEFEQARTHLTQALTLRRQLHANAAPQPSYSALVQLFDGLLERGQLELASMLRQAFGSIDPDNQAGHQMQIKLDIKSHKLEQALEAANRAVEANPSDANSYQARLLLHLDLKNHTEALRDAETLVSLNSYPETFSFSLGRAFFHAKKSEQALKHAQLAHALAPSAQTHNLLGLIHGQLRHLDTALQHIQQAIGLDPDHWHYRLNLGNIYLQQHRFELAERAYQQALEHSKADISPYLNGMVSRANQLDIEGVRAYQQQAEVHFPDHPYIRWTVSLAELLAGNFEEGWKLYESRWSRPDGGEIRSFDCPRWDGKEDLNGKTILIHIEQGYGDFIQMSRYSLILVQRGARVILEVYGPLIPLMQTLPTSLHLIERGLPLTEKEQPDFEIPIMSLPLAFNTRLETIPYAERYLGTLPERVEKWQAILGKKKRPRIGLAWSGNAVHVNDHNRSMTLQALTPLFDLPFDFHCLQHQVREADREAATFQNLHLHTRELHDFGDAAALADEMDLVISVDSAPAHLAGALGKPTWILLPYVPDFRWLLDRADSPWYPSAVLFRQTEKREWDEVISTVVQLLADIAHPPASTTH